MAVPPILNREIRVYEGRFDFDGPTIEFVVGSGADLCTFHLHESLVCANSHFCKCAMNGTWKESESRSVVLDDVEPSVFRIYMAWLYRTQLPVRIDQPPPEGDTEYLALARAYVLGDRLQDVAFCDACVDTMLAKSQTKANDGRFWYPDSRVITCIYDNTTSKAKARELLVDLCVTHGDGSWLRDAENELPKDFLFDLALGLLDAKPDKEKWPNILELADEDVKSTDTDPCRYHEHGEDGGCYLKLFSLTPW